MVRIKKQTYDQAIEKLNQSSTCNARNYVWDHITAQPTLYFVHRGSQSCSVPWILFEEDQPTAMIFTNYERAIRVATSCLEQSQQIRIIGLPTNATSMYINALAGQGVCRVCFNHGPQRFDAYMDEVLLAIKSLHR